MDARGYNRINRILDEAELLADVKPELAEGENVRYVTVETNNLISPSTVLNVLKNAGLIYRTGEQDAVARYGPELQPLGVVPGSITFEDKNSGYN